MNYLQKYLKYKFKYLTLKLNLEFAVENSKNFYNGKMKYLNLKKNIVGGTNHSESELLDAIRTANVLKVNQMITDGVNINASIIRAAIDNLSRCIESSLSKLKNGPEQIIVGYSNYTGRQPGILPQRTKGSESCFRQFRILEILHDKLKAKYQNMIKVFSHAEPTIKKVEQELEDTNQEDKNRIEELEKQKKLLDLQKQVKNVKPLFLNITKRVFSKEIMGFLRSGFQEAKDKYLQYRKQYDTMVEKWEKDNPYNNFDYLQLYNEGPRTSTNASSTLTDFINDEYFESIRQNMNELLDVDSDMETEPYIWGRTFN